MYCRHMQSFPGGLVRYCTCCPAFAVGLQTLSYWAGAVNRMRASDREGPLQNLPPPDYGPTLVIGISDKLAANVPSTGLEAVFLENRERLRRFLVARGAGDAAEDLLQEVWLKIATRESGGGTGPVASPLAYLFRTADLLMIDRYRSARQTERRERDWSAAQDGSVPGVSDAPSAERHLIGREHTRLVAETLATLGPRVEAIFRRHRIEGVPQRHLAQEFGVSLSTVESDLRRAYAALAKLKERLDEA